MTWVELSAEIEPSEVDEIGDQLNFLGAVSISCYNAGQNPVLEPLPGSIPLWDKIKIVGLFTDKDDLTHIQAKLHTLLPHSRLQLSILPEQDWTRSWLVDFKPLCFGQHLWVLPTDFPPPDDPQAVLVRLDPGLAFGTGNHATTAMCLSWLDQHPPKGQAILDYGCGSGILAIAALKLGASHAWAIDYDPQALRACQDNQTRNGISPTLLQTQTPENCPQNLQVNTLLANILAQPLMELAPQLSSYCVPGGSIVLSGILEAQSESVQQAYAPWFDIVLVDNQEGWILIWGVRKCP